MALKKVKVMMVNPFKHFITIRRSEWPQVLLAFIYFFSLLGSYYVLRPIREEMSMQQGSGRLQENFLAVFLVMLLVVPIFGWLTKRFHRSQLLPWLYGFFSLCLVLFYFLFNTSGLQVLMVAKSFFVWVSVYNLFVISVFWSFMADIFTTEQSSRLNGVISAGGTLGAITGPLLTAILVEPIGAKNLLLVSGGFLLLAIFCLLKLRKSILPSSLSKDSVQEGFEGSIFSGVQEIFSSPYLLGICLFLMLYAVFSTFLYGISTDLVPLIYTDSAERTRVLAEIDLAVNILALMSQFFIFGKFIEKFGRRGALLYLPVLTFVGFSCLSWSQELGVLIVFGVLRRAGEYSISKPARETLFNVLPADQKYRAKNIIDTLIHRTGDVSSVFLFGFLKTMGLGIQEIAIGSAFLSILWLINAGWLSRKAEKLLQTRPPAV